ncbi:MAG: hypothetical protein ACXWF9_12150 [Solirubrobacterales bacterium]
MVGRLRAPLEGAQRLVARLVHLRRLRGLEHLGGVVLGLLHVGLVERVDAEHPARHRGRELCEEERAREHPAGRYALELFSERPDIAVIVV